MTTTTCHLHPSYGLPCALCTWATRAMAEAKALRGCHAARTGEGYWTCDVPGGCTDCRALAAELGDTL